MSLTITLPPETEAWLQQESSRQGIAPEALAARRLEEHYHVDAIRRLQQPRPASEQARFDQLIARLRRDSLDAGERAELRRLTDENERLSGERLVHLLALSRLWNRPVPEVMAELGIRPPDPI